MPRGVALGLFVGVIIPVHAHVHRGDLRNSVCGPMSPSPRLFTLIVNPLTIPPLYYAAYRIGSWELHHDAPLVNPAAAERFSSELSRLLFWIHQASGPIALGVLTIAAVAAAVIGYFASSVMWRAWLGSKFGASAARRVGRGYDVW